MSVFWTEHCISFATHVGDSIQHVVKAALNHATSPISAAEQLMAPEIFFLHQHAAGLMGFSSV